MLETCSKFLPVTSLDSLFREPAPLYNSAAPSVVPLEASQRGVRTTEVVQDSGMPLTGQGAPLNGSQQQPVNWTTPTHTCKGQTSSITAVGAAELQNKGCLQELENIWDPWKSQFVCELMK